MTINNQENTTNQKLVESAILIAVGVILSMFSFSGIWTQGDKFTACSMLPLVVISWRHGCRWGTFTAFLFGIIQLVKGFSNVLCADSVLTMVLIILLDYILAFSVIGMASMLRGRLGNPANELIWGIIAVFLLRLVFRFISGVLVWNVLKPNEMGWSAPLWSFLYNSNSVVAEIVFTCFAAVVLFAIRKKIFLGDDLK